jgi:hypothetical protein
MNSSPNWWEALFGGHEDSRPAIQIDMRPLKKRGHVLLLLPAQPRLAALCLDLYPAQTAQARFFKKLLQRFPRISLPLTTRRIGLRISGSDGFVKFLASRAGWPAGLVSPFGVLAGNPAHDSQRFILLTFDPGQRPISVVKAGLSAPAKALIEKEKSFLISVPQAIPGVPRLRGSFSDNRVSAFSLDFFSGDSPGRHDEHALPGLLGAWVDSKRPVSLVDSPNWLLFEQKCRNNEIFRALTNRIHGKVAAAALQHGDFAPWNIKVSKQGVWTVLDWERGKRDGVAGWDWFHYVIQTGVLVGKLPVAALVGRVEELLDSAAFKQYADKAGIAGVGRELVLAYLLHIVEVIQPAEGGPASRELFSALARRWNLG